jgi:hypothetical protein
MIGFLNTDKTLSEEKKKKPQKNIITKMIESRYSASGDTEDVCFKTTADLVLEFEDMADGVTNKEIADILNADGYNIRTIDDKIYWVLYEHQQFPELDHVELDI